MRDSEGQTMLSNCLLGANLPKKSVYLNHGKGNKMGTIEELKAISGTVVRRLRRQKLDNGSPFLIWSNKLPKNQSYLEYPDHSIKIVTVAPNLKSFTIV